MKKSLFFLIISLVFLSAIAGRSFAFENSTLSSISSILNPDGTVKPGMNGSYNVQGFKMGYTETGAPRFEPEGDMLSSWQGGFGLTGMNSSVFALTLMGTDVFAGGNFTTAGGLTVNYIAKWNGTSWSALGTGMNAPFSKATR